MKKWRITVSQNGWEYTGEIYITAKEVKQIRNDTIKADNLIIRFDEEIGSVEEELENEDR